MHRFRALGRSLSGPREASSKCRPSSTSNLPFTHKQSLIRSTKSSLMLLLIPTSAHLAIRFGRHWSSGDSIDRPTFSRVSPKQRRLSTVIVPRPNDRRHYSFECQSTNSFYLSIYQFLESASVVRRLLLIQPKASPSLLKPLFICLLMTLN